MEQIQTISLIIKRVIYNSINIGRYINFKYYIKIILIAVLIFTKLVVKTILVTIIFLII